MNLMIGVILGVLWLLGMLFDYRLGGAIYVLLVGAIVAVLFGLNKWWQRPA